MHKVVDSIYDALTPEERVAQICATSAGNLAGSDGRFSAEKARARIPHGIGHVCQFACNRTDEPEALAQFVRDVQAFCLNETRTGIPAICHEEVISGHAAACTKHFLGYGTIGGGEQRGWRDIFEEVVFPHESMINVGGASSPPRNATSSSARWARTSRSAANRVSARPSASPATRRSLSRR